MTNSQTSMALFISLLESAQGAGAPIISQAIERISAALSSGSAMTSPDIVASVTRKSFILSVDMAHGMTYNTATLIFFIIAFYQGVAYDSYIYNFTFF